MRLERALFGVVVFGCAGGAAVAGMTVLSADVPEPDPVFRVRSGSPVRPAPVLDPLEFGVEFAQCWKQVTPLPVDVRVERGEERRARRVAAVWKTLPPPVQRVLSDHGGKIVCSDGTWRRWMRGGRPAAAAYWDDVMAELAETHHQRTEIATRRAMRHR